MSFWIKYVLLWIKWMLFWANALGFPQSVPLSVPGTAEQKKSQAFPFSFQTPASGAIMASAVPDHENGILTAVHISGFGCCFFRRLRNIQEISSHCKKHSPEIPDFSVDFS